MRDFAYLLTSSSRRTLGANVLGYVEDMTGVLGEFARAKDCKSSFFGSVTQMMVVVKWKCRRKRKINEKK